jgi:hypothetical protein
VADIFIHAEVKSFAYDELDIAIAWASGPSRSRTATPQSAAD